VSERAATNRRSSELWSLANHYTICKVRLCFKWLRCEAFEQVVDEDIEAICQERIPWAYPGVNIEVFQEWVPILRQDVVCSVMLHSNHANFPSMPMCLTAVSQRFFACKTF
jgi:hypothetical protein